MALVLTLSFSYGTVSIHVNSCYYLGIRENGSFAVNDIPVKPIKLRGTGSWKLFLCSNPKWVNAFVSTSFDEELIPLEIDSIMLLCFASASNISP